MPAFHLRGQLIETKLITTFHKLIHLHHKQLFRQQTAFIRKPFTSAIYILHCLTDQKFIIRQAVMGTSPPHCILCGNTGTKTMSGQTNQQGMYIISRLIAMLLIQSPRKSRLKKYGKSFITLISRYKPLQRRGFRLHLFAIGRFSRHSHRLFHIDRHRFGIKIQFGVEGQTTILLQ